MLIFIRSSAQRAVLFLQTVAARILWSSTQPVLHPGGGVGFWADGLRVLGALVE